MPLHAHLQRPPRRVERLEGLALAAAAWLAWSTPAAADEESAALSRPGLVARYEAGAAVRVQIDPQVGWRSPAGADGQGVPMRIRWQGRLRVATAGDYTLAGFLAGSARVRLAGREVLRAESDAPAWSVEVPLRLEAGEVPLEVDYEQTRPEGTLRLFWRGPQFGWEPLGYPWCAHDAVDRQAWQRELDFEARRQRGESLVRALRCGACHALPGQPAPPAAPGIDRLAGNILPAWLSDWLRSPPGRQRPANALRRMPEFVLTAGEAQALAAHLLHEDGPPPAQQPPAQSGRTAAGERLFRTLGCLACHRVDGLGRDELAGGGDLSTVGAKRPREFFARWLADPAQINRHHRMPVFDLSDQEVADLSRYLAERGAGGQAVVAGPADSAAVRKQGAELYQALRCAACHEREANRPQRRPFARGPWPPDGTCLGPPDGAARRPGYRLAAEDQRAVRLYLEDAEAGIGATRDAAARRLEEWNCLACHGREGSPGLAELSEPLLAADGGLHDAWPALWPPSLTGVGHKLHDEALRGAIARRERGRRSWSKVRMPRFPLAEPELNALVRQLVEADRIPPRPDPPPAEPDAAAARTVAARLVTSDGFGCTSCHAIGGSDPPDVALPARGPDLARLGQRVRRSWFDRWVRNPARIVPRMEMPAVQQPVRGVLEDRLDLQLAAIWQVLNEPGFRPPRASPLRVVRSGNDPAAAEGAHYILDLVEAERRAYPRPLLIGLPNRHNLLVDLAAGRLAEWTVGDTARRRTRAKSWYWELAGSSLLPEALREAAGGRADLAVRWSQGGVAEPSVEGQFAFDPDLVEHVADGVRLEHRLRFELGGERLVATVRQTVTALWPGPGSRASGFRRRVEMEGLGDRAALLVRVWPPPGEAYEVRAVSPGARPVDLDSEQWVQAEARSGLAVCELEYLSPLPVDRFAPGPPVDRRLPRQELPVVPGWEAVRLPLTDELMPTGLAWRSDGALVVASLEGRVWLARDSDGDGWHDLAEPVSDELPAPFGVAVRGAEIDLLAKPGLLRLSDFAGGRARRCQTVAAGWGYTGDYHDWAVGLPRDAQGNYYVALPCQQDERSEAAAALRGSIVRLRERPPDRLDPRPYAVELVASGFRFPMGLTLGPEGELFASDNQGNYTPFNELNHVVPGRRYGFLNRLEVRRRLRPGDQRAAVEIPHPWTRSVNGLCYLGGPSGVVDDTARKWFGPWAGHLVGCEYDTRRLVRLSLERVQGEFQGAVYPLSRDPLPGEPTFEGPMTCAVAPDGALFVGNLRDSGWGAGANTGSIVRLAPRGELPAGIAEVRAVADGWLLEFTVPVDRQWAAQATSYTVASYRREATADYGGPDLDRRREAVLSAQVAEDGRRVHLRLGELREGYVYELAVRSLVRSGPWFPDQAHYTLRRRPR